MKLSNSPTAAMLWSLCIPGFGQLYNRDYINGLVLVALEFLINVQAKLNLAILFSFRGQIDVANQIADIQCCFSTLAFILIRCGRHIIELRKSADSMQRQAKTVIGCAITDPLLERPWAVLGNYIFRRDWGRSWGTFGADSRRCDWLRRRTACKPEV